MNVLTGRFLPAGRHGPRRAKGWMREAVGGWIWATPGFSPASPRGDVGYLGRVRSFPVPSLSVVIPSGEKAVGREAGAEHVKGRALLPIKLQTVSQEIASLTWSCFSQAFGLLLYFCVRLLLFSPRDRPGGP